MSQVVSRQLHLDAIAEQARRAAVLRRLHEDVLLSLEVSDAKESADVLARARKNVATWRARGTCSPAYIRLWTRVLDRPEQRLRRYVLDSKQLGGMLMQNTPFSFLLRSK